MCSPKASPELSNLTLSPVILQGFYKNLSCGKKNRDSPKDV